MESKISKSLIPLSLTVIIIAIGFIAANFITKNITSEPNVVTSATKKNSYEINKKAYDSIANPNSADSNISLDASGFGRENPFLPYK